MILADKIIEERKKLGWSQEELAAQLNVSRQSVSKWESAQSIPDLNRILQMAQMFGVTTDYLLKEDAVREKMSAAEETAEKTDRNVRQVSMEEASDYLALKAKQAPVVAGGTALCVVSCVPLMLLTALSSMSQGRFPAEAAAVAGVAILLLLVASAVFLFIQCSSKARKYDFLEEVEIETAYGVDGMAKEKRAAFEESYTRAIGIGVVLCILSAVPLILSTAFTENEALETLMVGVLLILVAIAVDLFVNAGTIRGSYDVLLQEGDYTVNKKKNAPLLHRISGIYWLSAAALYLAVSLMNNSWHTSWILWPVAAVLFGAVMIVAKMILHAED